MPALGEALAVSNNYDLPGAIEFTLAGFTTSSHELAQQSSHSDAASAASYLRIDKGGTEDGYVAIREVLDAHPGRDEGPITVILVTDEDRDVTDASITLESLSNYLVANGVVLHVVGYARITCQDHLRAFALDQNGIALRAGTDGLLTCEHANADLVHEYAELAWATDGLVWDIAPVSQRYRASREQIDIQQLISGLTDRILMQWPATSLARVEYWPTSPRVGDVVTFDASDSIASEAGHQITSWAWDFDEDGAVDEYGSVIAKEFRNSGAQRVILSVTDNSMPPITGRRVIHLEVGN